MAPLTRILTHVPCNLVLKHPWLPVPTCHTNCLLPSSLELRLRRLPQKQQGKGSGSTMPLPHGTPQNGPRWIAWARLK